ncbi:MAG TPA: alpha-E domain-containing protein [Sulfurovum sp.]|jgi:hypothetical protein|nr:MAG: hypothetical protein B7Y63_05055 [Sulfurovum sp. 35-42-20]OYZ26112.1 MAG: hypothetical protein B7Y23_02685 [Sulfurovum sp. 16-42-52]OYZ49149.1 MAG: hypothetical protein B7Y13_05575 [Sulfurovum sp. 24-42-9]OZA46150.1 MAG: hypothetical protein B7X80_03115 [Sulfurovum sp. 17-42-90]OZA59220.1 MAG: hypothetical protein B7X69_08970 [Sulfurovum sp. 39-42-12]HQR74175.1 alpha-E domain-containing protein [Sulfurovum sp.]
MEQLLTANVASSMYWLGRYLQRMEGTLYEINKAYDLIIDVDRKAGTLLYKKFDIDIKYVSAMDFLHKAIRGKHAANFGNLMLQARENAIISRAYIDSVAFGEIIALNELFQSMQTKRSHIDYNDLDKALSLIMIIWGAHAHRGHRKSSDYFFKLGKLVEEVDLRLRLGKEKSMTDLILKEINVAIKMLNPELDIFDNCPQEYIDELPYAMMECIYATIDKLIIEE